MFHIALALFLVSLTAALLGFSGVVASASVVAKILFVLFLIGAPAVVVLDELARR
jgi:uncharacterized membrane protein YtjA (UPF0391 family)